MNKIIIVLLVLITTFAATAKILHSERSLYRNIYVEDLPNKRCMVFGRRSKKPDYQSCINLDNPKQLLFSYTKFVMAGLLFKPNPKSVLIIGLGGGTLPVTLEYIYPDAKIDTAEIDPAVLRVAIQWFDFKESENQKVHLKDGRVFVKQQNRKNKKYDLVILDAFNGDYIPEHLMTEEFFLEIKQLLNSDGLLIANTFSRNKLYHFESATYNKVFGDYFYLHSDRSGNRIIYANFKETLEAISNFNVVTRLGEEKVEQLISMGVDFDKMKSLINNKPDWKTTTAPLTDQFSPANLLNQ